MHTLRPLIPMLCVVDCDPHGIDIMRMYKHGSRGLGHEANARVPGLQWLGVKMDDIILGVDKPRTDVDISEGSVGRSSQPSHPGDHFRQDLDTLDLPRPGKPGHIVGHISHASEGADQAIAPQSSQARVLMALTPNDRKTAKRIFKALLAGRKGGEQEFDHEELEQLRELQVMLMLNMKAEIQAIDNMGDLSDWLDEKMVMA